MGECHITGTICEICGYDLKDSGRVYCNDCEPINVMANRTANTISNKERLKKIKIIVSSILDDVRYNKDCVEELNKIEELSEDV